MQMNDNHEKGADELLKKACSVFLTLAICLSLCTSTVFAAEGGLAYSELEVNSSTASDDTESALVVEEPTENEVSANELSDTEAEAADTVTEIIWEDTAAESSGIETDGISGEPDSAEPETMETEPASMFDSASDSLIALSQDSESVIKFSPDQLVEIESNPSFHFHSAIAKGGSYSGVGEDAPITENYYMAQYLVTNAMYKDYIDSTGAKAPSYWKNGNYPEEKANHPVLYVSYLDAERYCTWLSTQYPEWQFRLPTEAEWENACFASALPGHEDYMFPWGTETGMTYNAQTGAFSNRYGLSCNATVAAMLLDPNGAYGPDYVLTYVKDALAGQTVKVGELLTMSANGSSVQTWANHSTGVGFIFTDLFSEISASGGMTLPVNTGYVNNYGLYGCAGNAWCWTDSWITAANGAEAGQLVRAVRGGSWYATVGSCSANTRGEGRAESAAFNTISFRVAAVPADDAANQSAEPYPSLHAEASYKYINGIGEGTFAPDRRLTRAQAATIFYNLLIDQTAPSVGAVFSDVKQGEWYYEAVEALCSHNIILGYPDGSFEPNSYVSRAEFIAMLCRFYATTEGDCNFTDVSANEWYFRYVASAAVRGWVHGYDNGDDTFCFRPYDKVTRAEAVAIVNRALGRDVSDGAILGLTMPFSDVPVDHWAYNDILIAAS